jgi:hypothetical protein
MGPEYKMVQASYPRALLLRMRPVGKTSLHFDIQFCSRSALGLSI